MPDNQGTALEDAPAEVSLATEPGAGESTSKGQPSPKASAETAKPQEGGESEKSTDPDKPWEAEGKSAEDFARAKDKSYRELQSSYNKRDKEITSAREAQDQLGQLKSLVGLKDTPADNKAVLKVPETPGKMDGISDYIGEQAAGVLSGVEQRLQDLETSIQADKSSAEQTRVDQMTTRAQERIAVLVNEFGVEEYNRVMRDPRYEKFVANEILVDGKDPYYVFRGLRGMLTDERANLERGSSTPTDTAAGGALPPGSEAGGQKEPVPLTHDEKVAKDMNEALLGENPEFWAAGKDK